MYVAGVPIKNLGKVLGIAAAGLTLFILIVLAFPSISNRVSTWKARIVNFVSNEVEEDASYQTDLAKMAIAEGQIFGKGPGKSIQKNFLPQSNSDFVFAIITEEYGLVGASTVVLIYLALFRRMVRIARKAHTKFGTLLVLAAASGMILQHECGHKLNAGNRANLTVFKCRRVLHLDDLYCAGHHIECKPY
jgi:cell division protein FtsW